MGLRSLLLVIALLAALVITVLTESRFFVAGGSDAAVEIYSVSLWTKALTTVIVSAVWIGSVVKTQMPAPVRWGLRLAGLAALALATHLVVFNTRRGMLEEHWFLYRWNRAAYSRAEGLHEDWASRRTRFGIQLTHRDDARTVFVFTGIAPWKFDVDAR